MMMGRTTHEQDCRRVPGVPPDEQLKIWPVDNKVGNVRNSGAKLVLSFEWLI